MATSVNFDNVFTSMGVYGRWQMMHLIGASLSWIHSNISYLSILIAGYVPDHVCHVPSDINGLELNTDESCTLFNITSNVTLACKWGYRYNTSNVYASLVSEWNLVCDKEYISWLSQTLFAVGQLIGSFTFTYISDIYGRKRCYLVSHLFWTIIDIAGSFVPNIYWFSAVRLVTGILQTGTLTIAYVYIVEMFPLEKGYAVCVMFNIMGSVGTCLVALFGYLMQNVSWRYIQLTIGCLFLPTAYQIWFFDESVRWLWANNKKKSVYRILKKSSKINRIIYEDVERHLQKENPLLTFDATNDYGKSYDLKLVDCKSERDLNLDRPVNLGFIPIIKNSHLLKHLLVLLFIWPSQYLTFFGVQFMTNELSGNRFLNIFLYGVVDVPSKLVLIFLSKRMGRKEIYVLMMIPCSLSLLIATVLFTPYIDFKRVSTAFVILSKFFVAASLSVVLMCTPELYPTNLRSTGVGIASASSRIACMAAPFAGYQASYTRWIPCAIFSILGFVSCVLIMFLPETKNKPLLQNIEDVQTLNEANRKS